MVGQSWVDKSRIGSGREGKCSTYVSGSMVDRRL